MQKTWNFHFYPQELKQKGLKDYITKTQVKTKHLTSKWHCSEMDSVDIFYNEDIIHDFVCLVYETKQQGLEESSETRFLEQNILYDYRAFNEESTFKQLINELNEREPGKYIYIILSSTNMSFVPIVIDSTNSWYRFDISPLTGQPFLEKPQTYKMKEFTYSYNDNNQLFYTMEYLQRDPRTCKTQGIELKLNVIDERII